MTTQDQTPKAPVAEKMSIVGARSAYATPVVSRLGSIRELTLGTSNQFGETGLRNL